MQPNYFSPTHLFLSFFTLPFFPSFILLGTAIVNSTMRKFSFSIKKQSISSVIYAIKNCIQRLDYRFIVCKYIRNKSTKFQTPSRTAQISRLKYTGWKEFLKRTWRIMRSKRMATSPSQMMTSRRLRKIKWNNSNNHKWMRCHLKWWCPTWFQIWLNFLWWCRVSVP